MTTALKAGWEAGIQGQAPPIADISIDTLCARFGEIDLAPYDFTSDYITSFGLGFEKKIEHRVSDKRKNDFPWIKEKYADPTLEPIKSLNILKTLKPHDYIEPIPRRTLAEIEPIPRRIFDETGNAALRDLSSKAAPQTLTPQQCDKVDLIIPEYKAGVVVGYVGGIILYVTQQGLLKASSGTPDILFSQYAWEAYSRGLALETPGIARDYKQPTNDFRFLLNETDSETHFRVVDEQKAAGYRLGFAVRVAREYGIALDTQDVPFDNSSYDAFMRGFRGAQTVEEPTPDSEPTHMTGTFLEQLVTRKFEKKIIIEEKPQDYFLAALDIYASRDQQMCATGQRVREAGRK